jgi:UDP-3-O-acyl-N-acetylglucosamine deacetylase
VDLLGDLFLVGRPLVGQVIALKTGHDDNHRLLREVLAVSG